MVIRERVLFDSSTGWDIITWPGWQLLDTVVGVLLGRLATKPVSTRPVPDLTGWWARLADVSKMILILR